MSLFALRSRRIRSTTLEAMARVCDDKVHHLPGLFPGQPQPSRNCQATRFPCSHPHGNRGFLVCNACFRHSRRSKRLEPHGASNVRLIHERSPPSNTAWPGHPAHPGPSGDPGVWIQGAGMTDPPWPEFLTRACDICQRLIQSYIHHINAGNLAAPEDTSNWEDIPYVSCTCKRYLGTAMPGAAALLTAGMRRRCWPHLDNAWDGLKEKKDENDRWLRSIERSRAHTGQLVQATRATKRRRVLNRMWRACPCGRECTPGPPGECEVWFCMAW